jgi:hypothetical protein
MLVPVWDEVAYLAAWRAQVADGRSLYPWLYGAKVQFPDYELAAKKRAAKKRRWAEMARIRKARYRAEAREARLGSRG